MATRRPASPILKPRSWQNGLAALLPFLPGALIALLNLSNALHVGIPVWVGKAIIYASPDWPYPHSFTWQSEALHAVLLWGWVMAAVLAPALVTLLPRLDSSPEVAS